MHIVCLSGKIFGKTCLVCVGITILKYENLSRQNGNIFLFSILKIVTCSGLVCPVPLRFNIVKQTWEGEISLQVRVSTLTLRWEPVTTSVYVSQPTNSSVMASKKNFSRGSKGYDEHIRSYFTSFRLRPSHPVFNMPQTFMQGNTLGRGCIEPLAKTTYAVFYFPEKHCNRDGTGLCWHSPMFLFFLTKRLIRST